MPDFPVPHYLQEFAQTHVYWVGDTIQPSHALLPSSPFALNLSQHQGLFQLVGSSQMAKSIRASASASQLLMNSQGWFPLELTGLIFLPSKGHSRIFSSTTVWKHQFFDAQPSLWSISHFRTWLQDKPLFWLYGPLFTKWYLWFFNILSRLLIAFLPKSKHLLFQM